MSFPREKEERSIYVGVGYEPWYLQPERNG
jgi:hypothetical protein